MSVRTMKNLIHIAPEINPAIAAGAVSLQCPQERRLAHESSTVGTGRSHGRQYSSPYARAVGDLEPVLRRPVVPPHAKKHPRSVGTVPEARQFLSLIIPKPRQVVNLFPTVCERSRPQNAAETFGGTGAPIPPSAYGQESQAHWVGSA